jgi:hypothetical protein
MEERMRRLGPVLLIFSAVVLLMGAVVYAQSNDSAADIPLKEAKLNIEHNATDEDTGFLGAIERNGNQTLSSGSFRTG